MKKLLFILLSIPLLFSSCQTCKECEPNQVEQVIKGYTQVQVGSTPGDWYIDYNGQFQQYPDTPIYEEQPYYGDAIRVSIDICRDNFQSKDDYNTYIDDMEDADYTCKSDFWN